jgi:hypothetical protein
VRWEPSEPWRSSTQGCLIDVEGARDGGAHRDFDRDEHSTVLLRIHDPTETAQRIDVSASAGCFNRCISSSMPCTVLTSSSVHARGSRNTPGMFWLLRSLVPSATHRRIRSRKPLYRL